MVDHLPSRHKTLVLIPMTEIKMTKYAERQKNKTLQNIENKSMPTNSKTKHTSLQFEEIEQIVELVMTRMFEFLDLELIITRIIKS